MEAGEAKKEEEAQMVVAATKMMVAKLEEGEGTKFSDLVVCQISCSMIPCPRMWCEEQVKKKAISAYACLGAAKR